MSIASLQADAFYRELAKTQSVWTIRGADGFPTSTNGSGETAMPFWSTENRARAVIDKVEAYAGFSPHRLELEEFRSRWLPGLDRDGLFVGLNWSGERAVGFDVKPSEVLVRLKSL
ncbi:MAG: hypothetical protein B7Z12_04240 [Caulobacter vibrioides]|uniref:DUF2750 domain-containing protein n=1 Tax=Caulobacter vibrioides TaxID=155892 RepID=A0A258DC33_CAUVI|nr:MAG: hypothetical protein B7Z12_04240 [Caulobacter vibrioides]